MALCAGRLALGRAVQRACGLLSRWAAVVTVLGLAACASPRVRPVEDTAGAIVPASVQLAGQPWAALWYLPVQEAQALVVLQPGFTRQCGHLRETSRQLMAGGLMVLCVDAPMAGGNPALADELADALAAPPGERALNPPHGRALPALTIAAGHSAGAAFAARLGARLAQKAPRAVGGALLFDPVATARFAADLQQVSEAGQRPVLAVLAPPHACNAQGSALPALQQVQQAALAAGRAAFVGVHLGAGATHADVEGAAATGWRAPLAATRSRHQSRCCAAWPWPGRRRWLRANRLGRQRNRPRQLSPALGGA